MFWTVRSSLTQPKRYALDRSYLNILTEQCRCWHRRGAVGVEQDRAKASVASIPREGIDSYWEGRLCVSDEVTVAIAVPPLDFFLTVVPPLDLVLSLLVCAVSFGDRVHILPHYPRHSSWFRSSCHTPGRIPCCSHRSIVMFRWSFKGMYPSTLIMLVVVWFSRQKHYTH
jgi:hypothetical protein